MLFNIFSLATVFSLFNGPTTVSQRSKYLFFELSFCFNGEGVSQLMLKWCLSSVDVFLVNGSNSQLYVDIYW